MYERRRAVQYTPTGQEIELQLAEHLLPYQTRIRESSHSLRTQTLSSLEKVKDLFSNSTQRQPSRLMVCVQAIGLSMQTPLEDLAFRYYDGNQPLDFAFWSDVAWGVCMVRAPLYLGEEYIREYGESAIQRVRHEQEEYLGNEFSLSGDAEAFLDVKLEGQEAARLLMKDRSGFTLARTAVEWVKQPHVPLRTKRIYPPNRIPAIVIAGAELCQLAYETIYPLTEGLL